MSGVQVYIFVHPLWRSLTLKLKTKHRDLSITEEYCDLHLQTMVIIKSFSKKNLLSITEEFCDLYLANNGNTQNHFQEKPGSTLLRTNIKFDLVFHQ